MFRVIPACFEFNFGDLERCENEIKKFIEFYWEICEKCEKGLLKVKSEDENYTQTSPDRPSKSESPKKIAKK